MTTLREAAQQALEALEQDNPSGRTATITTLRAALAEHDKDRVKIEQMKANWNLQRKLAQETEERDRQRQEEALQRLTDVQQEIEDALAEPAQEPVAWYFEARQIDSAWSAAVSLKHPGPEGVYMRNVKPLYTTPPALRAALAEPAQEPVAWIQPDHLQKARVAPFLCRVEPTQRCADFVAIYTSPPQRPAEPVGVVTSMVKGGVTWRRWPADMPDGTLLFSQVQP